MNVFDDEEDGNVHMPLYYAHLMCEKKNMSLAKEGQRGILEVESKKSTGFG